MKPVRLFADIIQDNLRTNILGREIIILERTTSTMDIAKKMLKEGAIEGTTIFVEEQTQGRGRTGILLEKLQLINYSFRGYPLISKLLFIIFLICSLISANSIE